MVIPVCLGILIWGLVVSINEPSESKSYVLSPEELGRWRSIKPGMERHEVTAILGQPDGPPVKPSLILARPVARTPSFEDEGLIVYTWGRGKVRFRPNGGSVVDVIIPEFI